MSKITISVDNTSDMGEELYKKYNLEVIYFGVVIGDNLYRDTQVKPEDIYKAVEVEGLLPKTNAALEIDYRELFERATQDGGHIIHLSMSDKLSASHSNAIRAAKGLERVHVIDTKSLSAGIGLLAIRATEMVKEGKSVEEIVTVISALKNKINISLMLKDLNYLYRGGRASGLKLLGANILKIRPSLIVTDGKIIPDRKFKGEYTHAIHEWTNFRLSDLDSIQKDMAFIVHSDIDVKLLEYIEEEMRKAGFKEVTRLMTGPTLTTHVGRNLVGTLFLQK